MCGCESAENKGVSSNIVTVGLQPSAPNFTQIVHHIISISPGCLLLSGICRTFVEKITKRISYVRCLDNCYTVDYPWCMRYAGMGCRIRRCVPYPGLQYRLEKDRKAEQKESAEVQGKETYGQKGGVEDGHVRPNRRPMHLNTPIPPLARVCKAHSFPPYFFLRFFRLTPVIALYYHGGVFVWQVSFHFSVDHSSDEFFVDGFL